MTRGKNEANANLKHMLFFSQIVRAVMRSLKGILKALRTNGCPTQCKKGIIYNGKFTCEDCGRTRPVID